LSLESESFAIKLNRAKAFFGTENLCKKNRKKWSRAQLLFQEFLDKNTISCGRFLLPTEQIVPAKKAREYALYANAKGSRLTS
jgi:hypothetical protein